MKKESRTKNSIRNTIFGVLNKMVMIFMPFVVRTIIIKVLGNDYVGLNSLFTSILQVLSLAELGFGSALVYNMYKPVADGDNDKLQRLLNLYKKVYRILGLIILGVGIVLTPFLPYLVKGDCPINLYILYYIYLGNTVITYFLFAYKTSLLNAYQRSDIIYNVSTLSHFLLYSCQIVVLFIFKNYYIYIAFLPLSTIVNNLINNFIVIKMFPGIVAKGEVSKEERQVIFSKVRALIGHKIGSTIIQSADSIIISAFLGLSVLSIYSNYFYIITAINGFVDVLCAAILASIGNSLIKEGQERNYFLFKKLSLIMLWISGFCTACLICLYQPFMYVWVGKDLMFEDMTTIFILGLYFYSWSFRRIGLSFKDAAGLWSEDFWKPYIGAIVNVVVNIALVMTIGINGVFISTIIVFLFIYFPWETKVLFSNKMFDRRPTEYLLKIFYNSLISLGLIAGLYFLTTILPFIGWLQIFIILLCCLCIFNVTFLLFNIKSKEMQSLIGTFSNSIKKLNKK